jgi:chromosome segregation ATPase
MLAPVIASVVTELSPVQLILWMGGAVSIPTIVQGLITWLNRRQLGQNQQAEFSQNTVDRLFHEIDVLRGELNEVRKQVENLRNDGYRQVKIIYTLKEILRRVRMKAGFSTDQMDQAEKQDEAEIEAKLERSNA